MFRINSISDLEQIIAQSLSEINGIKLIVANLCSLRTREDVLSIWEPRMEEFVKSVSISVTYEVEEEIYFVIILRAMHLKR